VIAPAASSGALLLAVIWAGAALILPWIVRGRRLATDVVAATAWAAGSAAATIALGGWLGDRVAESVPRGAVVGAVVAGVLAVALTHLRRPPPATG
jgi:hypothetical protein